MTTENASPDVETSDAETDVATAAPPTLGRRLQTEARRIATRRLPGFGWVEPFSHVMKRVTSLPLPAESRFRRIEMPVQAPYYQPAAAEPDPYAPATEDRPLPPQVLARLQDVVGPTAAKAMRVHDGPAADVKARSRVADAVTVGRDVYFQKDRLRPEEDAGFALLAHEAAHVMQYMLPNPDWRRATQTGAAEQEQEAAAVEQTALAQAPHKIVPEGSESPLPAQAKVPALPGWPLPARRQPAAPPLPGHPAPGSLHAASLPAAPVQGSPAPATASPAARPMAAAADRPAAAAPVQAPANVEALREQLFRDLMARIKSDSERGA